MSMCCDVAKCAAQSCLGRDTAEVDCPGVFREQFGFSPEVSLFLNGTATGPSLKAGREDR